MPSRRTIAASLVLAVTGPALAGCSGSQQDSSVALHPSAPGGGRVAPFNEDIRASLVAGGRPQGTVLRQAGPGRLVRVGQRPFPGCRTYAPSRLPGDERAYLYAVGRAVDGDRRIMRAVTVYPDDRAAAAWVRAFTEQGIGCATVVGGTAGSVSSESIDASRVVTVPEGVEEAHLVYRATRGVPGVTHSSRKHVDRPLGSTWTLVTREGATVALTSVYVPGVAPRGGAVRAPRTAAYVGRQSTRLIQQLFGTGGSG